MTTALNVDFKEVAQKLLMIIVNSLRSQLISGPNGYNREKTKIGANMRLPVAARYLKTSFLK